MWGPSPSECEDAADLIRALAAERDAAHRTAYLKALDDVEASIERRMKSLPDAKKSEMARETLDLGVMSLIAQLREQEGK